MTNKYSTSVVVNQTQSQEQLLLFLIYNTITNITTNS